MAFKVYTSNIVEYLGDKFCKSIGNKSKWTEVTNIIVQTKGIETWLINRVTTKNQIFANYEFLSPDSFLEKVFMLADISSSSYFSMENLKWKLFELFNGSEFKKKFEDIADYYTDDDVKRIQLSSKTADLFEQYLIYRPEFIEKWSSNEEIEIADNGNFNKHQKWQQWLWIKLKEDSNNSIDKVKKRELLYEKITDNNFKQKLKNIFPKVSFFGIVVISDFHFEIYQKLSEIIDVEFYTTLPSVGINDKNGNNNELLSSCNALSSAVCNQLNNTDKSLFEEPKADSLLSTIQIDIYKNSNNAIKKYKLNRDDNTVQIASSYTAIREVEALCNYLLNEFENNSELKTSDVSIQVTDINIYAPLIEAVFESAPIKMPYSINDIAYSDGDSIIKALELFFNLPNVNFKAESVLQLLEFKAVRDKFDIADVDAVREIIADANIRYGIEGREEDDTYLYSWNHGLTKLVLGYAIKGGDIFIKDDREYFITDKVEGAEALNIFKIKALFDTIENIHKGLKANRTLKEWKSFLHENVINGLFDTNGNNFNEESQTNYEKEIDYIDKKLSNIEFIANGLCEEIPFKVFQQDLLSLLSSETKKSKYLNGNITVSTIIPVRSIPFKIIAMLGLNSDKYPRDKQLLGFDLINLNHKPNDRDTKSNDKHLFLENIISSREKLYISYIGSSVKDNSELPPSILIEELEDYIISGNKKGKSIVDNIKYSHPLHSSSSKYFDKSSKFFTYLGGRKETQTVTNVGEQTKVDLNFDTIDINDLIKFYKDPFKWYYNKTLKIYYGDDDVVLPEEELFGLDKLQQWVIKNDLVKLASHNEAEYTELEKRYINRKKNDGAIQLANIARVEIESRKDDVSQIRDRFLEYATEKEVAVPISIKIDNSVLSGKVSSIYNNTFVFYNVSGEKSQPKYLMEAWLKHLVLTTMVKNIETSFISSSYNFTIKSGHISSADAKSILAKLIEYFKKGHSEIVPFMINEAFGIQTNPDYYSDYLNKEIEFGFDKDSAIGDIQTIGELIFDKTLIS